ncbi:MAG: alpha/beta fold hydrolase [Candidatus Latescibacteria bacterium]|nr:alpha/beta fold hydrolase [Candidatus Latescibacterota bacterium]NIM21157.1 alpha/beta fold hydrolase [Candidatus Latescibacterota bacterium]NIM65292.1 alpha/beta fold hydrolase [Candidatus Latescibacterota bacterium]NIO01807.1 alpha/beta fold hydrolase [Candidatus Latescibacterota bacterium]NIO28324.1 alpha/beta fold hydrolase [Candidatus Latescibacterota bacterium]
MRHLMAIVVIIIGAYLLVCLLAFLLQSQMIHFPDRKIVATPGLFGVEYRDVFFETEDAVSLHGWFIPLENARACVLFCHGNAGNISHRLDSIRIFRALGLAIFIFDYRSYGRSGGRISEMGLYADARAARRFLVEEEEIDPARIVYFGRSLGSALVVELATHHLPLALIAESCFTSIPDLGRKVYPWLPVRLLSRIHYDSTMRVAGLTCPKLFIHSREDEIVPFSLGRRLFELAPEPKTFLEISGTHNEGFLTSGSTYVEGLKEFLGSLGI